MNEQFILGFCYGTATSLFSVWLWWEFSAKKRIEREKKRYSKKLVYTMFGYEDKLGRGVKYD